MKRDSSYLSDDGLIMMMIGKVWFFDDELDGVMLCFRMRHTRLSWSHR